jgi:hypothetical protein
MPVVPVGDETGQGMPVAVATCRDDQPYREDVGSIIIVVAIRCRPTVR